MIKPLKMLTKNRRNEDDHGQKHQIVGKAGLHLPAGHRVLQHVLLELFLLLVRQTVHAFEHLDKLVQAGHFKVTVRPEWQLGHILAKIADPEGLGDDVVRCHVLHEVWNTLELSWELTGVITMRIDQA